MRLDHVPHSLIEGVYLGEKGIVFRREQRERKREDEAEKKVGHLLGLEI